VPLHGLRGARRNGRRSPATPGRRTVPAHRASGPAAPTRRPAPPTRRRAPRPMPVDRAAQAGADDLAGMSAPSRGRSPAVRCKRWERVPSGAPLHEAADGCFPRPAGADRVVMRAGWAASGRPVRGFPPLRAHQGNGPMVPPPGLALAEACVAVGIAGKFGACWLAGLLVGRGARAACRGDARGPAARWSGRAARAAVSGPAPRCAGAPGAPGRRGAPGGAATSWSAGPPGRPGR